MKKKKEKSDRVSCSVVSNSATLWTARLLSPWHSTGKNTGMGSHFLTQELNPGLPQYRQILYHLSHQGSL